jgi:hypothetical protein
MVFTSFGGAGRAGARRAIGVQGAPLAGKARAGDSDGHAAQIGWEPLRR